MKSLAAAVLFLVLLNLVLESDTTDTTSKPTESASTPKPESHTSHPKANPKTDVLIPKPESNTSHPKGNPKSDVSTPTPAVDNANTGATSAIVTINTSTTISAEKAIPEDSQTTVQLVAGRREETKGSKTETATAAGDTSSTTEITKNAKIEAAATTVSGSATTDKTSTANNRDPFLNSTETTTILSTSITRVHKSTTGMQDSQGPTHETGKSASPGNTGDKENTENKNTEQRSPMMGFIIPLSSILVPFLIVVSVCLYKMCQGKSPVAESAENKLSAQNKESVKLLSVKSSDIDSDLKRATPSNHTEFIAEC
eukprot:XP_004911155.1 PREDICTED: endomucin isoform X1 [Xenopus tropicalis]